VYKYTFKAPDRTAICVDEIDAHLSGRLLSVAEAVHRLLSLPLHKEFPPVTRLDVHLPRQQSMVFDPTADEEDLLAQIASTVSTLMGWFELNKNDMDARHLYYHEVPEHYVWKDQRWHKRCTRQVAIGRIYNVSHHNIELFAIRRLLRVIQGATSFEDMATHNGVLYPSFSAACRARSLVLDDEELVATMMEIIEVETSVPNIRRYFAMLLINGAPNDAQALFNQFVDDLSDGPSEEPENVNAALWELELCMQEFGKSLSAFGFVLPTTQTSTNSRVRHCAIGNIGTSHAEAQIERDRLLQLFTIEQHEALQMVTASIGCAEYCNVFAVLSSAGCGKTVFANGLAATLRCRKQSTVTVAASALAAMLLTGGSTAHSRLHIPIPANEYTTCSLSSEERRALRAASAIIYDECSMVHRDIADTVDRTLRDVMDDPRPFGGKTVVFMGDFKQLLPVVRHGKGQDFTMQRCLWWPHVKILKFTINWRAAQFPEFSSFLEDVGHGRIEYVNVPSDCIAETYEELISAVYGDHFAHSHQILALTLETCAEINKLCINKLPGQSIDCPAADVYIDCATPDDYPQDYIESVHMNGAPPFMLTLKVGARYMCIRNLDPKRGLINGTMLQLLSMGSRYIQCRITSGPAAGSVVLMMKCVFTVTPEASGLPFTLTRRQYPIIPAYCLSVHKAQGQTLKMCGVIFESDPFTHGQLYVALSRVASWHNLSVHLHSGETRVHNVVHKHLLQYDKQQNNRRIQ
jgi:hypothetical protein